MENLETPRKISNLSKISGEEALSSMYNRAQLSHDIDEIKKDKSIKRKYLVIINVSFFSRINFLYGYEYGNEFIKEIAIYLENLVNPRETGKRLYSLYGAEFATIVTDINDLDNLIENIKTRFTEPWIIQGLDQFYIAAIGTVEIEKEDTADKIIYKATMSCKYSKQIKSVKEYNPYNTKMNPFSTDMQIEYHLRRAIMSKIECFKVRYQPIVSCKTGGIRGLEALCSWHDDDIGFRMPNDFIGFAEYLGLIDIIDSHVLKSAIKFTKKLHDLGYKIKINVNLSSKSFFNEDLALNVKTAMEEEGLEFKYLNLEITEGEVISNLQEALKQISEIKKLGISMSLDDFGTGYSSLGRLKRLPVDNIKIDRSFIKNLHNSEYDKLFVRMVIELAKCLSLTTICEGVETVEDLKVVKGLGADYVQGYLFSRPIYEEEVLENLITQGDFSVDNI
ncbi:MAG: bifunctional diguanylate cyclase/phosphodiesterase [Defluviitaleaceae bacterium]|nr:bifunctional diguanylate cyclase/phosphodiesterase [Defluviitaleaceae bacterium]